MWPKRKKGKARATKVKLKALQPLDEQNEEGSQEDEPAEEEGTEEPQSARSREDELISGVWKQKVLSNYKQNPKDSHNLLARIPSGKAAFEAGERQKAESIKEAMIKIVDRMFDNFQNTAYQFNQVTAGSDLELTWIRPTLMQEDLSAWHDRGGATLEVFAGRISTRYWTLAVRGTIAGIGTYILPSDKLLGFSTSPSSFPCYLSIIPDSDGLTVNWLIAKKAVEQELFPSVYRALLDGLIRFASEEAQPGEAFRLEDIGFVPEAPKAPTEAIHGYKDPAKHDLLGQSSGRNLQVSSPRISDVQEARADRFIDDISNQVALAAQSETDKFRESMQAPPFGTTQPQPKAQSQNESGAYKQVDSGAFRHSGVQSVRNELQGQESPAESQDSEAEWKSVSSSKAGASDWRQFMESTKEHIQTSAPNKVDDKWNAVPGTEQLARPEVTRTSMDGMMPSPPQTYASYGNAQDPPELLKPEESGYAQQQHQIAQNQVYAQQQMSQSGAFSAQQIPPQLMPPPMMPGPNPMYPGMQQPPMMPPPQHPGMMNHPGLPSIPGMIQPSISQSGVHKQPPMMPGPNPIYPGMQQPPMMPPPQGMPPQGMLPGMPPGMQPGMPPQMMPGQQPDAAAQFQNQYNTGAHGALPQQQQYNTGGQPTQYNTGPQAAQPMPPQYQQQQPGQYHVGPYGSVMGHPVHDPRAYQTPEPASEDHVQYLLSESDFQEQTDQYSESESEEQSYEQNEEEETGEGWEEPVEADEETIEAEEATWEDPNIVHEAVIEASGGFPQESYTELPVMSSDTVQRFEQASKAGFVFSSENDLVDAISVVLATIDAQIELLAQQGTQAFTDRDFRRAETIIKLSERLTGFKTESQAILQLLSSEQK